MSELGIFYPTIPNGVTTNVTLTTSGDNLAGNISLADFKTALESGVVLLSFPTEGGADMRAVVEHTDDTTNGLRIGVFSEDEYIVYSVVGDGNDGVTLTVVSENKLKQGVEYTVTDPNDPYNVAMPWTDFVDGIKNHTIKSLYNIVTSEGMTVTSEQNIITSMIVEAAGTPVSCILLIGITGPGDPLKILMGRWVCTPNATNNTVDITHENVQMQYN